MANLIVEIGNTALKAAWEENSILGKVFRYQGENFIDYVVSLAKKEKPYVLAVASVRVFSPEVQETLAACCTRLILMDALHSDICVRYGLPEYLPYDRVASIVSASKLFKGKAFSIFDFGTTLTIDMVGEDGKYIGGSISPGCMTRFKSLNRYSRNLPVCQIPEDAGICSCSIEDSIQSGVISGMKFEIEGYLNAYPENIAIFTGGDAVYFANKMKNPIFVVCNLVLMGLLGITEDYVNEKI